MIKYQGGIFGFQILFRLHGSALFKSGTPAIFSSAFYVLLYFFTDLHENNLFDHPYPMAALIAAITFLLTFRANFAYNRYWEAYTNVHNMHSKFLDAAVDVAAFHYQSKRYDNIRPPAFGSHPQLGSSKKRSALLSGEGPILLERERERLHEPTLQEIEKQIDEAKANSKDSSMSLRSRVNSLIRMSKSSKSSNHNVDDNEDDNISNFGILSNKNTKNYHTMKGKITSFASAAAAVRSAVKKPITKRTKIVNKVKAMDGGLESEQSLFLQEAAHLFSLLSAVALSTMRNDIEGTETPLITFEPGAPFPHVDPDDFKADIRGDWAETTEGVRSQYYYSHLSSNSITTLARFLFGISRSKKGRTLYNAARPFRVFGGVSDAEIEMLQSARGPLAKVALCTLWLQEFISREQLAGSLGKVAPPIISRIFQFISDGMLGYNQARKIAYIPFPFPHAQITTFFVIVIVGFLPVLMLSFLSEEEPVFGFILNLITVMAFTGLHEVARELEQPFQNMPNDLPLNNYQGQFNEALMTMFCGYHPDAYWETVQIPDESKSVGEETSDVTVSTNASERI